MKYSTILLLFAIMTTSIVYAHDIVFQNKDAVRKIVLFNNGFVDQNLADKDLFEEQLRNQTNHNSFHLFSHGQPGQLLINNQWLSHDALAAFIQPLLQDKSHLNIYGCHFAQGEKGKAAVSYLETALGVSIAASDDITGVDGDWDLEVGNFKNGVTIQEYSHNLQQPNTSLPIEHGMAVTTCGSGTGANSANSVSTGFVLGVFDIREPDCDANGLTDDSVTPNSPNNWTAASGSNAYHHSSWTNANLGEVFGVDLEYDQASSPDIFLSSCGLAFNHNSDQYPMTGGTGGEVFRIDGTTGNITVLATLPSSVYTSATNRDKFTGLGNLSYNADQQKVYVTNLLDGNIYVVDATTTNMIDQTYNPTPGIPVDPVEAYEYTTRTRMVYGIEYNKCDNRLYFARPNTLTTVDILSVGLNADGTIGASTPTLETTIAVETNVVISDIEFSDDCTQMLTSERKLYVESTSQVFLLQTEPHYSDVKRHDLSGGTWSLASASYSIGNCPISTCTISDKNAGGGVSFGYGNYGACGTDNACADAMVATSDALVYSNGLNIYGLQISDIDGTSSGLTNSYFVDLDGNTGSGENADKSTSYDVDVFGGSQCPAVPCSIDTDGLASVSCTGTNAITFSLTPTGTSVGGTYNVSVSGGTISPTSGTYGAATTFTLNDGSAGSGNVTVTITDVTESSCTLDVAVGDPGTCLASCSIDTDGLASISCTGTDAITFSLTPTGTGVGGNYNVSVSGGGATSISPTSGTYGAATIFTLNNSSAGGGDVTVTLTDGTTNTCTLDVTVGDPGTAGCASSCSIDTDGLASISCTGTDAITFSLTPTGTGVGGNYNVSVSGGGATSISPTSGTYGAATIFTLNDGSAGSGNVTVTLTDATDNTCTRTVTVTDPSNVTLVTLTSNPTTCNGTEGTIQLTGLAASTVYSLNFMKDGVAQTAQTIMSNSSGEYLITNLDAAIYTAINVTVGGCTSNDVSATLTDPTGPTSCSITGTDPTTTGGTEGTADLTVNGGTPTYTYVWSNAETTEDLTNLTAGTYSVIVTDANSCTTTCSVTLTDPDAPRIDYPDYEEANNSCPNSPCHIIDDNIYLGTTVTDDSSGGGSSTADSDIDDALSLGSNLNVNSGGNLIFPVTLFNDTGNDAYFRFWMDWNGDGDFEDAGEQVANNNYPAATNNGSFMVEIPVVIPTDVVMSSIALRLRFSTDDTNSATPCGTGVCAADGEIEDYIIEVSCGVIKCLPVTTTKKE